MRSARGLARWAWRWLPRGRAVVCAPHPLRLQVVPGCTGERRSLGGGTPFPLCSSLGPCSPIECCSSNFVVWCVAGEACRRLCNLSFALSVTVGVGELRRVPTPPPPPLRAGGTQGSRPLQSERKPTFSRRGAADQKNLFFFFKLSSCFASLPPTRAKNKTKVSWNSLFIT